MIEISIDEIVLDGPDLTDVAAFRAALTASLTRLATGRDGPVRSTGPAEALGDAVARSVWREIAPAREVAR